MVSCGSLMPNGWLIFKNFYFLANFRIHKCIRHVTCGRHVRKWKTILFEE